MRQDITYALWRDAEAPARRLLSETLLWKDIPKELLALACVRGRRRSSFWLMEEPRDTRSAVDRDRRTDGGPCSRDLRSKTAVSVQPVSRAKVVRGYGRNFLQG